MSLETSMQSIRNGALRRIERSFSEDIDSGYCWQEETLDEYELRKIRHIITAMNAEIKEVKKKYSRLTSVESDTTKIQAVQKDWFSVGGAG